MSLNAYGSRDFVLITIDSHEVAKGVERGGGRSEVSSRLYVESVHAPEMEENICAESDVLCDRAGCCYTSRAANKSPLWLFLFGVFIWLRTRSKRTRTPVLLGILPIDDW